MALEALARELAGQTGLAEFVYRTLADTPWQEHPGDDEHRSGAGKETNFA
jgi:hypothetical protein